jgi:HEAT repeat protein
MRGEGYLAVVALCLLHGGCDRTDSRGLSHPAIRLPDAAPEDVRDAAAELQAIDPSRRALAAARLGEVTDGREAAAACLLAALQDEHHLVRRRAAESLGRLAAEAAVIPLMRCLEDPAEDAGVRAAVAEALGALRAAAAVPQLLKALQDSGWAVRFEAARALGRIGDPAARELLERTVRYEAVAPVREAAAQALERIGP